MSSNLPKKLRSEREFRQEWTLTRAVDIFNEWCLRYDKLPFDCSMNHALEAAKKDCNFRMGAPRP